MAIRIGIQGELGSSNERAALVFIDRHKLVNPEIVPLRTTLGVLEALVSDDVAYGTFAWESSRAGLVQETQDVIGRYPYRKIDEVDLDIDHALLQIPEASIDRNSRVHIFSHPQALAEHKSFLMSYFSECVLEPEADTAFAAFQLAQDEYPRHSLVIADRSCVGRYCLEIFKGDLPANEGYWTKFLFVTKGEMAI